MICKNCGHYNWPYISRCKRCGSKIYGVFWKGRRLREIYLFTFFLCLAFMLPTFFKYPFSEQLLLSFATGIVVGILFGWYMIAFLKKRIRKNTYFLSENSKLRVIGILISLFFITVSIFAEDFFETIEIPLYIACLIGISFSVVWIVLYESKNGDVFME